MTSHSLTFVVDDVSLHLLLGSTPHHTSLSPPHPKRKDKALSFRPGEIEGNTRWGSHFVENLNSSLAVTVMFAVSLLVLGNIFAVCWSVWKKDVQGAFGVAVYVTSVITLAAMTWQTWLYNALVKICLRI
jgi:hypothetical protein